MRAESSELKGKETKRWSQSVRYLLRGTAARFSAPPAAPSTSASSAFVDPVEMEPLRIFASSRLAVPLLLVQA